MYNEPKHDQALQDQIITKLLKTYPNLKLGGILKGPVGLVTQDGRSPTDDELNTELQVQFSTPSNLITVQANTVRIELPLVEGGTISGLEQAKYIHPYKTSVMTVQPIDASLCPIELDEYTTYALFRFGVSGLPEPSKTVEVERTLLDTIAQTLRNAETDLISFRESEGLRLTHIEHSRFNSVQDRLKAAKDAIIALYRVEDPFNVK